MRNAFSMMELVFIIVIIGILSSIALIHIPAQRLDACKVDYITALAEQKNIYNAILTKAFLQNKPAKDIANNMGIPVLPNTPGNSGNKFDYTIYNYNGNLPNTSTINIPLKVDSKCIALLEKKLSNEDLYLLTTQLNAKTKSCLPDNLKTYQPKGPDKKKIKELLERDDFSC